jgi:predicted O-linked N-acetylglucosamine transferase (SPINDLY family)
LACDLPIVTMPGPFMRSRHTAAILQMMGITETIADSLEDYVAIAIRLANNSEERQARSRDVAQRKRQLYRDGACISALEEFLDQAARIVPDGSS